MKNSFTDLFALYFFIFGVAPLLGIFKQEIKKQLWFLKWDTREWYQIWLEKGEQIGDPNYEGWDDCWDLKCEFKFFGKDRPIIVRRVPLYVRLKHYFRGVYYRLRFFIWFALGLLIGYFL